MHRIITAAAVLTLTAAPALAGPSCDENAERVPMYQVAQTFEESGGEIKLMKVTGDHCFEIYGYEDGKRVEIYYDPATGEELERHVD